MAHYALVFSLCFHTPCFSKTPVNVLRMYRGCRRYAPGSTPTRLLGSRCHRAARFTQVSWQRNVAGDSSPYWGNLYDVGPAHDEGTDTTNFEFIEILNFFLHHTLNKTPFKPWRISSERFRKTPPTKPRSAWGYVCFCYLATFFSKCTLC